MNPLIIALDLGGTWMKGTSAVVQNHHIGTVSKTLRKPNPLSVSRTAEEFATAVESFCLELTEGIAPCAIAAATAGEVNATGDGYLCAGSHLGVMGTTPWVKILAEKLNCPVTLINDAEAFLLGAAEQGRVPSNQNIGALVIGTGLGFAMARKGRWWKPSRRLIHLGAIQTGDGDYNQLISAVRDSDQNLFSTDAAGAYLDALAGVIVTSIHLFHLETVLLGGGLVDAAKSAKIDLIATMKMRIPAKLLPGYSYPEIVAVENGNSTILEGTLALAAGNLAAETARFQKPFTQLATESGSTGPGIETFSPEKIIIRLANEEAEAARRFCSQTSALATGASMVAKAIQNGGRVIYLGAGTSGRVGALDAVEIPCTFGLAEDRFVAVIAGGVADAALTIEDQFEEDTSSVADLILVGLRADDVVIGVSASGSAFFVRSGLGFARTRCAKTFFIHEANLEESLADLSMRLESGPEIITGSTRMKAGTATKKALNILSTTAMILLGKVRSGEMIDLQCSNAKLRARAVRILSRLKNIPKDEALQLLAENNYRLRKALDSQKF